MTDERAGLARAIIIFFVAIGAAGLLYAILNQPVQTIFGISESMTTTTQASRGRGYVTNFWDALPFVIVMLAFLQLIGAAAIEGRLPGQ